MGDKILMLYQLQNGKEPYSEWIKGLRDSVGANRIRSRIARLARGNFGDHKPVGDGVFEIRFQFGPGYRIYFGKDGDTFVILLCGGDKSTQSKDITLAKAYWAEWLQDRGGKEE
mgnify:CR=1 FL=1